MRYGFIKAVILVVALALSVSSLRAGERCPSMAHLEAEQALRLHSELMVIGLTCQKYYRQPSDIYTEYQKFTAENANLLRQAENNLVLRVGVERFHALRTNIANDVSRRAAFMSPKAYCQANALFVGDLLALSSDGVRQYVARLAAGARQQVPACVAATPSRSAMVFKNE
ncbi:MAG TPA: hypothetical protein DCW68_05970 [Rhodospirillaceae bacterium]|nr:MAG: hypothetical protein A2018_03535 [Alphaproteobacteria bacterium GWF2_58_20]HAU29640.1 hypothetical protein [Rhodospirillaceae bacterium]